MRIAHVITDMGIGGAPIMLQRLAIELQASGVHNTVIALGRVSRQFESMRDNGISLHEVGMTANVPSVAAFFRLGRLLVAARPDVVQTWMYHADLLGGLAARAFNVAPVVWGLHHTPQGPDSLKPTTWAILRANSLLSSFVPARIACCAQASEAAHIAMGYARKKTVTIRNGFDTCTFVPDDEARRSVRRELCLPEQARLIGLMARFHPQKGHRTFIRAASNLNAQMPDVHFMLAGRGVNARNSELGSWIAEAGLGDRCHLLGIRDDMPRLLAACDILTSSSGHGEGFPLVLGEAMSCGVPCVTTDVGDSALLVGDTGRVVAPDKPEALAAAWQSILSLTTSERTTLGERARERVLSKFPLAKCVDEYVTLYRELCPARAAVQVAIRD